MISIYSLIWTFINCGLMTLVILFLRTRKNFLADYGTFALVVLFFCCIVRMFVPIEFPEHQFIIHNTFIYNHLLYPFFTIEFPEWIMYPIFGIWVFGSIIVFIRLFRKASHTERGIITSSQKATEAIKTASMLKRLHLLELFVLFYNLNTSVYKLV